MQNINKLILWQLFRAKPKYYFGVLKHISNWPEAKFGLSQDTHLPNSNLPYEKGYSGELMEKNEIQSRILKVCSHFDKIDLRNLNWAGDFQKDLGLDSLERVALITSIEHEFTTLFEDRLFDNFKTLEQVTNFLAKDLELY